MTEPKTRKGAKSYSIKNVHVPDGEWLTLLEGAAYARVAYAPFTKSAKAGELPTYHVPGSKNSKRVRKSDIDKWLMGVGP